MATETSSGSWGTAGSGPRWRAWLVLGRVSNLPTVASNVLAGWVLAGGGSGMSLALLMAGACLLYVAGMFLNDAFDTSFDCQFRRERPIPSGRVSEGSVWIAGLGMLALGWGCLAFLGRGPAVLGAMLAGAILFYDATHKVISWSPVVMALCRTLLVLTAAAAGDLGIRGYTVWVSIALGGWIVGLSYVARRESVSSEWIAKWPLALLGLPILLALLMNNGRHRMAGLAVAALLLAWAIRCVRFSLDGSRSYGRTVSGLLAGICLVDLLAVLPHPTLAMVFLACFAMALLGQRFIPAT